MGLDAGSSLALSGQAGGLTLTPSRTGQYQVLFGSASQRPEPSTRRIRHHRQRGPRRAGLQRNVECWRKRCLDEQGGHFRHRPEPTSKCHVVGRHESGLCSGGRLCGAGVRGVTGFRLRGRLEQRHFYHPEFHSVDVASSWRGHVYQSPPVVAAEDDPWRGPRLFHGWEQRSEIR